MAFVNQERKAILAAEVKKVMPKDWKYSLSVRHHSTIVLTISAAPVDLMAEYNRHVSESWKRRGDTYQPSSYAQVNEYHLDGCFSGDLLKTFTAIRDALNVGNHDRSDIQSDYFDVGWYVDICIGKWDKPFQVIASRGQSTPEHHPAKPQPIRTATAPRSDLANCWEMSPAEC
jgi:hypothetical protein